MLSKNCSMMVFISSVDLIFKFYIVLLFVESGKSEQLIYKTTGEVGGGNTTYYSLTQKGSITLILETIHGDADIYISETNGKPDFNDYDLQSATCGKDVVTIPIEFHRPVGIGIFGHVYHPLSKYSLFVVSDYNESESEHNYSAMNGENNSENWLFWAVVNILKILLEILA